MAQSRIHMMKTYPAALLAHILTLFSSSVFLYSQVFLENILNFILYFRKYTQEYFLYSLRLYSQILNSASEKDDPWELQTNVIFKANCLQQRRTFPPHESNKIHREDFDWPGWIM